MARKRLTVGAFRSIGSRITHHARQNISPRFVPYICLLVALAYGFVFTLPSNNPSQIAANKARAGDGILDSSGNAKSFQWRATNLEILRNASPVDISFKDVTGDRTQDPHRGAQDENFQWGYVPDEKALRRNPPEFNLTGDALKDACLIRDSDYKMIHEKVAIDPIMKATQEERDQRTKKTSVYPKILCVVQTSGHRHYEKIPVLRRTWGPKCDGFVVASNITDRSLGTVRIPHGGEEVFMRKWQRVRATWSFIYDNYYRDYDWFYMCNDMVFLLMENLRLYLESDEIQAAARGNTSTALALDGSIESQIPIFLGRRFALGGDRTDIFNSGGPGYVLNRAALKVFVLESSSHPPQRHTSNEDLMIARTFRLSGVHPYDTQDETGGERFMVTTPGHHYDSQFPAWYHKQSIDIRHGKDHCAERSISFHYVPVELMYRLYALLYGKCPPTKHR